MSGKSDALLRAGRQKGAVKEKLGLPKTSFSIRPDDINIFPVEPVFSDYSECNPDSCQICNYTEAKAERKLRQRRGL